MSDKLDHTGDVHETDLKLATAVSQKIKELLGSKLRRIILFGSRARGDASAESDFDFLILADFEENSWPKRSYSIRKGVGYIGEPVDYLPLTPEEFNSKLLIRDAIVREGVVLYESEHTGMGGES